MRIRSAHGITIASSTQNYADQAVNLSSEPWRSSRPPLTDARQFDILRSSPTRLGAHELHRLQRRDLITLLAGTTVLSPFTARAQQQDRMRRVGVIMGFAEDDEVWQAYLATFRQRLQDFGWTDGRNIRFDYRFTGESTERMRVAAAEMVAIAPTMQQIVRLEGAKNLRFEGITFSHADWSIGPRNIVSRL